MDKYIVYRKDVCVIKEIEDNNYYLLVPVSDSSLKYHVPIDSPYLRKLITKKKLIEFLDNVKEIPIITSNSKLIENEYRQLLNEGSYENLMRIIKTTYLRNQERLNNKKKKAEKDSYYFDLAEKYLYTEFSVVLGMTIDETRDYIINHVREMKNEK